MTSVDISLSYFRFSLLLQQLKNYFNTELKKVVAHQKTVQLLLASPVCRLIWNMYNECVSSVHFVNILFSGLPQTRPFVSCSDGEVRIVNLL